MLSPSGFPLTSAFFRPLQLGSDYSAFRSFLSPLPAFPCRRFPRCFFPLPSSLFPCLPSDSGTRLAAIPFSGRRLASQQLPRRLSLLPFGFRPFPLAFALGSGYSALGMYPFQMHPIRFDLVILAANTSILPHLHSFVNYFFEIFSTFFIFSRLIYRTYQSVDRFLKLFFCLNHLIQSI